MQFVISEGIKRTVDSIYLCFKFPLPKHTHVRMQVPVVRGSLLMRGGQYASPPDKLGLATVSAAVQRSGGSIAHPREALDDRLEDLAAAIEAGAGPQVRLYS